MQLCDAGREADAGAQDDGGTTTSSPASHSITRAVGDQTDWCVPLQRKSGANRRASGFPGLWKPVGRSLGANP